MNTDYSIKNFRVFDSKGADFNIRPITILTGANSSGKSSMVKSIRLLSKWISAVREEFRSKGDCNIWNVPMQFSDANLKLGNFSSCLNIKAKKTAPITFKVNVESPLAGKTFIVEYVFTSDEDDDLNDGWLKEITVRTGDKAVVLHLWRDENDVVLEGDLNPIYESFRKFAFACLWYDESEIWYEENHGCIHDPHFGMSDASIDVLVNEANEFESRTEKRERNLLSSIFLDKDLPIEIPNYRDAEEILDSKTPFEMQFVKKLRGVDKKDVRKTLEDGTRKLAGPESVVIDVFESSPYKTFDEFFSHYSEAALKMRIDASIDTSFLGLLKRTKWRFSTFNWEFNNLTYQGNVVSKVSHLEIEFMHVRRQDKDGNWVPYEIENKEITLWDICGAFVTYDAGETYRPYPDSDLKKIGISQTTKVYDRFADYYKQVFKGLIFSEMLVNLSYLSSSRVTPQRVYQLRDREEGDEFNMTLRDYMSIKRLFSKRESLSSFTPGSFIDKWIKEFRIGEHVIFKNSEDGFGANIVIEKSEGEKRLLADMGHGITPLLAMLIAIEVRIMRNKLDSTRSAEELEKIFKCYSNSCGLLHKGIVEYLSEEYREIKYEGVVELIQDGETILIEEPEIHLHPKYQSMLADMFMDVYHNYGVGLIIETHSEYLIRKLQTLVANPDMPLKCDKIGIYYFSEPDPKDRAYGEPQYWEIKISKEGVLNRPFGKGFFDENDSLVSELFGF